VSPSKGQIAGQHAAYLALSCVSLLSFPAMADEQKDQTDIQVYGYKVDEPESPKYAAPLRDTPKSVTILPVEVIQESGSTNFVEALRTIPGVTFGTGEGGNPQGDQPFIRGFNAQGSTYLDGIRSVGGQSREIFAIEQIEVVKGSDSTMGGRGSAGGSINLVSKMPHLGTDARADLSYGTADYKRAAIDANVQLADTIAVRLNAMFHDADVAGRDVVTGQRWGISPSIALGLGTETRAFLNYYHLESDEIPDPGMPFERATGNLRNAAAIAANPDLLKIGPAEEVNGQQVSRRNFYGLADRDFRKSNVDEFMFRFEHDISDTLQIRNTAKYANVKQSYILTQPDDSQGNVANGKVWRRINSRHSTAESLADQLDLSGSFTTSGIKHSFSAGLDFSWEQSKRGSYSVNTSPRCTNSGAGAGQTTEIGAASNYNCTSLFNPNPYDPWVNMAADGVTPTPITRNAANIFNEATTYAVYAADTISITDALLLNLGARYDWYSMRSRTLGTSDLRLKDEFFNYQAGLVYKPAKNGSIYVSFAKSTTPVGSMVGEGAEGNAIALATLDDLKPENTKSYEIGTKWDLLRSHLGVNVALFRTETNNARTTGVSGLPEYVGNRRIDGVEVGITGKPLPNWNVFGGYTYMDSEVRYAGPPVTYANGVFEQASTGRSFPNTPKHSFTLWSTLDFADRFQIGGGAIYNSRQYANYGYATDAAGSNTATQNNLGLIERSVPRYWRFDATASADVSKNVELRVNVQNLTNKRYYDRTYGTHFAQIAAGRSAFATLSLKY
jgi:catecholate siderophore receptor